MNHKRRLWIGVAIVCSGWWATAGGLASGARPVDDIKTEIIEEKYSNGNLMERREVYRDKNNRKVNHGRYQFFYETGQKREEVYFRHDKRQGAAIYYHRNGTKAAEATFDDDLRQGVETHWDDAGIKFAEFNYRDDKPEGLWTWFYPDGKKVEQATYVSASRQGPWKWWHPNGQLGIEGTYGEDLQQGTWLYYDAAGQQTEKREYKDGEQLNPPTLNPPPMRQVRPTDAE